MKSRLAELETVTNRSIEYVMQRTQGTNLTRSRIVNHWKDETKAETPFGTDSAMNNWHFVDEFFHIGVSWHR